MALSENSLFELSKKSINSTFLFSLRMWKGGFRMTDFSKPNAIYLYCNLADQGTRRK